MVADQSEEKAAPVDLLLEGEELVQLIDVGVVGRSFVHALDGSLDTRRDAARLVASGVPLWDERFCHVPSSIRILRK